MYSKQYPRVPYICRNNDSDFRGKDHLIGGGVGQHPEDIIRQGARLSEAKHFSVPLFHHGDQFEKAVHGWRAYRVPRKFPHHLREPDEGTEGRTWPVDGGDVRRMMLGKTASAPDVYS